jgi:hypothetical protein
VIAPALSHANDIIATVAMQYLVDPAGDECLARQSL